MRRLFNRLIKCREGALTKSAKRLMNILQVVPTYRRLEKEPINFMDQMDVPSKEKNDLGDEGGKKVRKHARRILCLLNRSSAPVQLKNQLLVVFQKKNVT